MPRQLALVLCAAFVLSLLRLERRRSAGVSSALWIPCLWMLAIASKPLGMWFAMGGTVEAGSVLDRTALTALSVAGIVVLVRRRYDWRRALRGHGWLLALLGYMLLSVAWSDIALIAFRRWSREVIVVIMALVVMSEANPRQALESVLRRAAYILIPFSLLLTKYYPDLGVAYGRWSGLQMWIGVTLHKNTLGRLCVVSSMFLLWALYRRWNGRDTSAARSETWSDVSVLLISLFLLKGPGNAYSATSIGTLSLGILMFLGLASLARRGLKVPQALLMAVLILLVGYGTSAPFLGGSSLAAASSAFGRDETLTGRTQTWAELVPVVKSQPLLGTGYGSFWTTARRDSYDMSNGHNGYLDILLELGVMGLVLFAMWLLSSAWNLRNAAAEDPDWGNLALCFLVMAVVYNSTESAFNSLTEQMTAVVVLASLVVPHEPVRESLSTRVRVRLHLPSKRAAGAVAAQPGHPEDRQPLRALDRGRGQRRRRIRPRHGGPPPGRTEP